MGPRARDWGRVDYYAVLGVEPGATTEQVAAAYRDRAKSMHPDRRPDDPDAHERFATLTVAYDVLGDPATRSRYDAVRGAPGPPDAGPRRPPPHRIATRRPLTPGRARALLAVGVVLVVAGVAVAALVVGLQRREAAERAGRLPADAVVADVDGGRVVVFTTETGERVVAPAPERPGEPLDRSVAVRYDPADPSDVVLAESTAGRDITLAIVAIKLVAGGALFAALAARALGPARRGRHPAAAAPGSAPQVVAIP